jgi:hypothetical protein
MGFKLAGIAINKDFSKDLTSLLKILAIENFVLDDKSTFDEENLEILEDNFFSVAFFEKGTFLSTGITLMTNDTVLAKASLNHKIVAFYINENSSTYCFDFFENGSYIRKKWISLADKNIDSSDNFGELLEQEKAEKDNLEIIFEIISSVIGKEFYEIEEDYPMFRYKINPNVAKEKIGFLRRIFG